MGEHVIKDLLTHFDDLYLARWNFKYLFSGKDAKLMKDLLAVYQPEDVKTFMSAFFASHDEFIQNSGYSLSVFRACLPKVIASVAQKPKARRCWHDHDPACTSRDDCEVKFMLELRAQRDAPKLRAV
jgi:hypothetical protein